MKKLTSFLTMALIALMSLSFSSCDEDANIAYTLDGGTWQGNMYVQYGNIDATYSVIHFNQNNGLYSGTGYWIDYFDKSYWNRHNYIANRISWTVRNRDIYIYLEDEGSEVVIYNYSLNDNFFSGYVEASNGNRAKFSLRRDTGSYNWRSDYDWWDSSWGYSSYDSSLDGVKINTRSGNGEAVPAEKPIRKFVVK